jgi:predicted hydrolase (HD superfamily)
MLSRFELAIVVRNQVRDRALVARARAVEAAMERLAAALGADIELWGLAGLGADLDVRLTAAHPERRGMVVEELLLAEGAPVEVAAAARARHEAAPERMTRLTRALVVAEAEVDGRPVDARVAECRRLLGLE